MFPGSQTNLIIPSGELASRAQGKTVTLSNKICLYVKGICVSEEIRNFHINTGNIEVPIENYMASLPPNNTDFGFLESQIITVDESPVFYTNQPVTNYASIIFPGRKSFFSNGAQKYSQPQIIAQIQEYGKFCDTYPNAIIDKKKGYGASVFVINPFLRPILINIHTNNHGIFIKKRIAAQSADMICLEDLAVNVDRWCGQVQIGANNRIITFFVRHKYGDQTSITDMDHFDPFRGEPTHAPITQLIRSAVGNRLAGK